jgi:hypothetical protein
LSRVWASSQALSGRFQIAMNEVAVFSCASHFLPIQWTRTIVLLAAAAAAEAEGVGFDFLQPPVNASSKAAIKLKLLFDIGRRFLQEKWRFRKVF